MSEYQSFGPLFQSAEMRAAITERNKAMKQVTASALREDATFSLRAQIFVMAYLAEELAASSEEITDAAKRHGIKPPDDRAFGPVFMALARAGKIEKGGSCARRKGHGTSGGNIWRLNTDK